jgi:hypothetical protein
MARSFANEALYDSVVQFVLTQTCTSGPISGSTELAYDLGLDGYDAGKFMQSFQDRFNVDLSHFNFDLHFGGEGLRLIGFIKTLLGREKKLPLTVEMLYAAAEAHRWPATFTRVA